MTRLLCLLVQNEEVLKKCAQDYLARIKQEEQRYQTLKLHAEEKLTKYVANTPTAPWSSEQADAWLVPAPLTPPCARTVQGQ